MEGTGGLELRAGYVKLAACGGRYVSVGTFECRFPPGACDDIGLLECERRSIVLLDHFCGPVVWLMSARSNALPQKPRLDSTRQTVCCLSSSVQWSAYGTAV